MIYYKSNLIFFALILPAIFLRLATSIYPNISTIFISFTDLNLLDGTDNYVGLKNYFRYYYNPNSFGILIFSLVFVITSTFLQIFFGLLVALLLNINSSIKNFIRTFSLLPWAIPMIVVAYTFSWLLDDQFGFITLFNYFFEDKIIVFLSPIGAKLTVILVNSWKTMPFVAILLLTGLQSINNEQIEAAKVDGAKKIDILFYIILPSLLPLITVISILLFVSQFGNFDLIFGLTKGGPGFSTQILALQIFNDSIMYFKFGYAAAESVILLTIVIFISLFGTRLYLYFTNKYE